jgi:hypothetical protein
MNNSYIRLIDGMTATLRQEVLTRLDDEFARGQVFGVINLLNTMRLRADWSVNFLHQQISAQRDAFSKVNTVLAVSQVNGAIPAYPSGEPPALIDANALIALRDEGNLAIIELLRWLWSAPAGVSTAQRSDIEGALRRSMRSEVEVELRHSSKPMFAEMSQGTEQE